MGTGKRIIKKEALKKKKKFAYPIIAMGDFREMQVGETSADEEGKVIGRKIQVPLSELTHDPRAQNVRVTLKVARIKDRKAEAEICEYQIIPAYIKRTVRVGKSKVDDSFISTSKDGIKVQLKPVILTRFKVQNSVKTSLRKFAMEFLKKSLSEQDYFQFASGVISRKIQKELSAVLAKVYPVGMADLRVMKRL
jgi:small subunit ribosomal protein S3Ae